MGGEEGVQRRYSRSGIPGLSRPRGNRRCYGHATILLHLQDGSPWPVRQVADIRLDKNLQTNDCDFLVSTLSDELLPEGTLRISMTYSSISFSTGSSEVDWERNYLGSPNDGEDRPGTSTKRNWVDSMWDDTEIRQFDMEEAVSCLNRGIRIRRRPGARIRRIHLESLLVQT